MEFGIPINTRESYERYLLKYPNGKHSKVAKDALLRFQSKTTFPDQNTQNGKKIQNWGYIHSLITYSKASINSQIAVEAINEIFLMLCENLPPQIFNSSHTDPLFRSSFIKAIKENKTFIIAFAQKDQSEGHISAILQELVGKETKIDNVKLYWKGDRCTDKIWTYQKSDKIDILPYGNALVGLNYHIPCKIVSVGLAIAYDGNSISVLAIGTESSSEILRKYHDLGVPVRFGPLSKPPNGKNEEYPTDSQ